MNVDEIVRNFQQFLEASWQSVESTLPLTPEGGHFRLDWLQANWEILVEAVIWQVAPLFLSSMEKERSVTGQVVESGSRTPKRPTGFVVFLKTEVRSQTLLLGGVLNRRI